MVAQPWSGQADKDMWHVLVAPGETKLLSLEQLDDFFRLEVIDASTRVWQPGMTEWLPLSVVAGLDDDDDDGAEPAPAPAPAQRIPPPPPSRVPSPPARAAAPPSTQPVAYATQPLSPFAPAPSVRSPSPRPAAGSSTLGGWPPAAVASTLGGWPPVATTQAFPQQSASQQPTAAWPQAARASVAPNFRSPESIRPMVVSERPPIPPRGSRFGNYLIGLAVLGAFGVTLYRNDVLRQVAKSAGQEQTYLQIERSLGSPGFGTPRAIEQLAEHTPKLEADTLSTVVPATPERTPSAAAAVEPAAAVPEPVAAAPAASSAPAAQESPAAERTEEPKSNSKRVAASAKPSLESTVAAQVGTRTKRSKAERPTAERSAPRREREPQREEPSKNLGFTGSSNSFDPLNGKL